MKNQSRQLSADSRIKPRSSCNRERHICNSRVKVKIEAKTERVDMKSLAEFFNEIKSIASQSLKCMIISHYTSFSRDLIKVPTVLL